MSKWLWAAILLFMAVSLADAATLTGPPSFGAYSTPSGKVKATKPNDTATGIESTANKTLSATGLTNLDNKYPSDKTVRDHVTSKTPASYLFEKNISVKASGVYILPETTVHDPAGTIYAATNDGEFYAGDGETFENRYTFPLVISSYAAFLVWADPDGNIYVSFEGILDTADSGLWRSDDGGNTFTRVLTLPYNGSIYSMAASNDGSVLYAVTYAANWDVDPASNKVSKFYRSTDAGANWTLTLDTSATYMHMHRVVVDPTTDYVYNVQGERPPGTGNVQEGDVLIRVSTDQGQNFSNVLTYSAAAMPWFGSNGKLDDLWIDDDVMFVSVEHDLDVSILKSTTRTAGIFTDFSQVVIDAQDQNGSGFLFPMGIRRNSATGNTFVFTRGTASVYVSTDLGATWVKLRQLASSRNAKGFFSFSNIYNGQMIGAINLNYVDEPFENDLPWDYSQWYIESTDNPKIQLASVATNDVPDGGSHNHTMGAGDPIPIAGLDIEVSSKLPPDGVTYDSTTGANAVIVTNTAGGQGRGLQVKQFSTDANGATIATIKGRGTAGTPAAAAENDFGFAFVSKVYDATATPVLQNSAYFGTKVSAPVTSGNAPLSWEFATGNNTADREVRLKVWHDGVIEAMPGVAVFKGDGSQLTGIAAAAGPSTRVQLSDGSGGFTYDADVAVVAGTLNALDLSLNGTSPTFVVDSFTTGGTKKAFSAEKGKELSTRIPIITSTYIPFSTGTVYTGEAALAYDSSTDKLLVGTAGTTVSLAVSGVAAAERYATSAGSASAINSSIQAKNKTSQTAAAGFGSGILFYGTDAGTTDQLLGRIGFATQGGLSGALTDFSVSTANAGTVSTKFQIASGGQTTFLNSGGLMMGAMSLDNPVTITVGSANTWYEIDSGATDFSSGALSAGVTQTDHYITVPVAQTCMVVANASMHSTAANQELALGVMVDGTINAKCHGHSTATTATQHFPANCSTTISVPASGQLSLAVENHDAANNITVNHADLSIFCGAAP